MDGLFEAFNKLFKENYCLKTENAELRATIRNHLNEIDTWRNLYIDNLKLGAQIPVKIVHREVFPGEEA